MRSLRWTGLVLVVVVAVSCTSSEESRPGAAPRPSPSPTVDPLIGSLPTACEGFGDVPRRGEITFVSERRLYASSPDGSEVRCIGRSQRGVLPGWGGDADRFFLQVRAGAQVVFDDRRYELNPFGAHPAALGLSRPTGTSVLFETNHLTDLVKMDAAGGDRQYVSFLERHDEAIYHPAGEHIAAAGVDDRGDYGVFVATNEGTEPHLLVLGEDAKRVYSLTFSPTGYLYYAAEHDDHYDVHGVGMEGAPSGDILESGLATFYSSESPIHEVVSSQFQPGAPLAVQVETAKGGCETVVVTDPRPGEKNAEIPLTDGILEGRSTAPVGWLPNGDLVLEGTDDRCRPTGEVFVWDGDGTTLLATGATAVAVRGLMPDPPDPPTKEPEVIA